MHMYLHRIFPSPSVAYAKPGSPSGRGGRTSTRAGSQSPPPAMDSVAHLKGQPPKQGHLLSETEGLSSGYCVPYNITIQSMQIISNATLFMAVIHSVYSVLYTHPCVNQVYTSSDHTCIVCCILYTHV